MKKKTTQAPVVETREEKKTMDLLDLKDAKAILRITGEVEVEKYISWDNTGGQRGVIKASYLNLTFRSEKGETRFIIGCTNKNLWIGKELSREAVEAKNQVIEL